MRNKIKSKLQISKSSWSPQKSDDEYVNYFSIPNFDLGFPKEEKTSDIKSGKFLIDQPCILISKLNPGTPRVWLIQDLLSGVNVCSTEFVVLIPHEKLDLKYIYFLLKSNTVTNKLTDMSTGTSNSHQRVRPESILELEVDWNENANERYVLSEFLWGLEQKISTNTAISKTLEEIAQTIFKSWFIDFDPVKAKMNGEKPIGMDDETAALFPDSFEESELGLIPKGWEIAPIGEVIEVGGGTTPSTTNSTYWDGEHCWTTPKDLSSQNGLITTGSIRKITDLGLAQISSGLLPINSVLMSCRAPIGYISINAVPTAVNQGFITLKNSTEYHCLYLVNWIKANMQEILNRAGGATFAEITRKAFREIPFLIPAPLLLKKYTEVSHPIVMQIQELTRQTDILKSLRDLLLPRLMSGELQIPEEMLAS